MNRVPPQHGAQFHGDRDAGFRDRLEARLRFERLLAQLSTRLIHASPEHLDTIIERGLGEIGAQFGVDRAYIFRFGPGQATMSNTHEWVAEGVSREADNLQEVPSTVFPWLMQELLAGRSVHVPRVADLPDEAASEREEFLREGIRSIALVPFGESGSPSGFIGFDAVATEHSWSEETMLGLELLGQMFDNAFRAQTMAAELQQMALHDELTGLANRKLLRDRLQQSVARCRRSGARAAVILIDIDDFKLINDSLGHARGDEVLQAIARRMVESMRDIDTVARIGGDEFVVVIEMPSGEAFEPMLERLIDTLREPLVVGTESITPSASAGIAVCPDHGDEPDQLLRCADAAMYHAKEAGRDRYCFFEADSESFGRERLRLREELRAALVNGEIEAHFQPRVCLASGRIVGFEALARWMHPRLGLLVPGEFLPLATRMGIDGDIDLAMLDTALERLAEWRRLHSLLRVSVNIGARHLAEPELYRRLGERLRQAGPLADGIELEITESAVIQDLERAEIALRALHRDCPGLQVSLDDFGSGYSSLNYLRRLPLTTLKIDRCFVVDLEGDRNSSTRAIVRSIVDLGRNLGMQVMAEGIETEQQLRELRELGCTEGQGFHFSPPVSAADAGRLLRRDSGQSPA